ncbi:MAG: hypothetical protein RLN79_08040 [Cytophagales bacterium]
MIAKRKELINMEMTMIMSKKSSKMKISYGLKMRSGQSYDGSFQMNKRPHISAILDHLFRLN